MPINQITPKYIIADKFLVIVTDNFARVKNPQTNYKVVPTIVREAIEKEEVHDFKVLFSEYSNTSLIPVESEDIFNICKPVEVTFVTNSNGDAWTPNSREGRAIDDKEDEIVKKVIVVRYNHQKKYLYYKEKSNSVVDQLDRMKITADIHHSKDISFYQSVLRLDQIKFSEEDTKQISDLFRYRYQSAEDNVTMFTKIYQDVRDNFTDFKMVVTIAGVSTKENFPKEIQPTTFVNYGRDANFLMMAIQEFADFDFAKNLKIEYLPFDRTQKTNPAYVCQYFITMLSCERYSAYWMMLVKLCAFDWNKIAENKTLNEETYRHTLDAIRAFCVYTCLYESKDKKNTAGVDIFRDNGMPSWEWFKSMYTKVVKASGNEFATQVSVINDETVAINGKPFSRAYIQLFVKNVVDRFESNLTILRRFFKNVHTVKQISDALLTADHILYAEDRSKPELSFLDLYKEEERKPMFACLKEDVEINRPLILRTLADMGVCIMWLMYFDLSGPARFPELLVLKYAGNDRNVFIDSTRRHIEIHFKYSKSHAFPSIVRSLDVFSSGYLLHFIVVERMMMREALGLEYNTASRDLFNDLKGDDRLHSLFGAEIGNDSLDDGEYSHNVAQSFLFLDPTTGSLLSREKFSKYYKEYPDVGGFMPATRLNFREMRQAMVAMIRGCVPVEKESFMIEAARELSAGHSVNTAFRSYGVDNFLGLGSETNLMSNFILRACRVWHKWLNLGGEKSDEQLEDDIVEKRILKVEGANSNDLYVAGVRIFGNGFQFKISQRKIATDLYLSNKKFFPIQALPGYGKTALFELPLVAMKLRDPTKRVVSFVFVPYISLMADMVNRLSKHGLKCKMVKEVLVWNAAPEESSLNADVYVCSYEDVNSDCLKTMINNWYYHYKSTYLGFIVIDEVHNFGRQDYRKRVTETFPRLRFDSATKVLFLSGSIGINNFDFHLKELGMNIETTSKIEISDKVFIENLVREIPLLNVKKGFARVKYEDLIEDTIQYVTNFLSVNDTDKVLIVCHTKKEVAKVAAHNFKTGKPLAITGDLPTEEKIRIIGSFASQRVLVGTNMVSEGIDIKNLKLVILVDHVPSVSEYIQIGGRMRGGGIYTCFYSRIYPPNENIRMGNPKENVNEQMKEFYGLRGNFKDNYNRDYDSIATRLMRSTSVSLNNIPLLIRDNKTPQKTQADTNEGRTANDNEGRTADNNEGRTANDIFENEEDDIIVSQVTKEKEVPVRDNRRTLSRTIPVSDSEHETSSDSSSAEELIPRKKKRETLESLKQTLTDSKLFGLLEKKTDQTNTRKEQVETEGRINNKEDEVLDIDDEAGTPNKSGKRNDKEQRAVIEIDSSSGEESDGVYLTREQFMAYCEEQSIVNSEYEAEETTERNHVHNVSSEDGPLDGYESDNQSSDDEPVKRRDNHHESSSSSDDDSRAGFSIASNDQSMNSEEVESGRTNIADKETENRKKKITPKQKTTPKEKRVAADELDKILDSLDAYIIRKKIKPSGINIQEALRNRQNILRARRHKSMSPRSSLAVSERNDGQENTTVTTPIFSSEATSVFTPVSTDSNRCDSSWKSSSKNNKKTTVNLNQLITMAHQLEEHGQDTSALKKNNDEIKKKLVEEEEEAEDDLDSPSIDRSHKRGPAAISTPTSKRVRRNNKGHEIKDQLKKGWGLKGSIFEVLGIDRDRSKYLFYDGMDDSSLPSKWYNFDSGCPKCLMSPVDACVCFGSSNWIKTMAYESLITLHSVLAPERYQGIVDDSLKFGCYSVLLNVVKHKKFYRELKYKQFLDFMDNIQPDLQQYPGYDSSRQMLHDFNNLWSYMKKNDLDIMAFCSGRNVRFPRIWKKEDKGKTLDSMRKHEKAWWRGGAVYAECDFFKNHNEPMKYVQKILMHNFKGYILKFSPIQDASARKNAGPDDEVVQITQFKYLMMLIGMYDNEEFQNYMKRNVKEVPDCPTISNWIKAMGTKLTAGATNYPLYMLVGAHFTRFFNNSSAQHL